MAVCKFYAQGRCKNGDSCRFEHPGSGRPRDDQNSFAALNQGGGRFNNNNGNNNRPAAPSRGDNYRAGSNQPLPFLITKDAIQLDLTTEKPQWPFSAYGPGRDAPRELLVDLEFSMEEMRLQYYLEPQAAIQNEQQLLQLSTANVTRVLQRLDEAIDFVIAGKDEHPNRLDMCQGPGAGSQPPPKAFFGAAAQPIAAQSGSSFGQPSSFGANASKPAFGAPAFGAASQPGGFGKPSALGQSSGFGQPSAMGQASAFGQPSAMNQGSAFGQPSVPGQGSAFGQPSAPGRGSAFGQPAVLGQGSAFGQPSAAGTQSAFGQTSAPAGGFGQPSALGPSGGFGQPSSMGQNSAFGQPSAVGQNAGFGQPSAMGQSAGFGQASTMGQSSAFGKPAPSSFGQPANIGRQASPFAQAGGAASSASPFAAAGSSQQTVGFGQASSMGNNQRASPFGQPTAPASQSAFGQPTAPTAPGAFGQPAGPAPQNAFGQPAASTTQNGFGQPSAAATPNAFGQNSAPASRNAFGQPTPSTTPSAFSQASTAGTAGPGQQNQGNPFGGQPASAQRPANPFGQAGIQSNLGRPALPPTKAGQHVFFPNGPPNPNPDIEGEAGAYNEILQAAYAFLAETGTFKDGIMPEVPPKSEWIRFDV